MKNLLALIKIKNSKTMLKTRYSNDQLILLFYFEKNKYIKS